MDLSQQELPLTSYFTGKHRAKPRKKKKLTEEVPSSVARPSKRTKNDVQPNVPQGLPTPAASVRKRTRGGESPQLNVLSPVERSAILPSDKSPAPPAPSTLPRSPCLGATGLPGTSLATPSIDRRKTTNPTERESLSNHMETGIATPQTSSRRVSEPMHRIDCTPLAPSSRPLPSKQSIAPRETVLLLPPKKADGEPSRGLPMFPVSSSQSQYLLPIDATPKRKQRPQRIEHVISSQSQEERELTLSSSLRPLTMFGLSIEHSSGKSAPPANAQTPHPGRRLGYPPVRSPITPSRSSRFSEKKKADELPSEFMGSPRRKRSIPSSRRTRTPRRITHQDSIENIPPVHIDDSVTESESDPDQVPCPLPVSLHNCPLIRREDDLPATEDDSATEAESDTEILRCVAEIGRTRRPEISRKQSTPAPVISPLVSPARPRIAPMPAQFFMPQGVKSSGSGSSTSHQPTTQRPCTRSDSLPSPVRDFITMFHGDESYPADFPESLRV